LEKLTKEVDEATKNYTEYKVVPYGEYRVRVEKLELVKSRAGNPMVTCWMRILTKDFEGSLIFVNQVVTRGYQIKIVNDFIKSLDSGFICEFKSYTQYANLLAGILKKVGDMLEYELMYDVNDKGYETYKITDVFDAS